MDRAKTGSWVKLVAGLVVGATAQPFFTGFVPVNVSGSALVAQQAGRPAPVHETLNKAIEDHRRGDYEKAAVEFQEVLGRQDELTEVERKEFSQFWQANVEAIDARKEGGRQLRVIENTMLAGNVPEANELLKKIIPVEQYLTPADKMKYKELTAKLHGKPIEAQPRPIELPKPIPVTATPLPPVSPFTPQTPTAPIMKPLTSGVAGGVTIKPQPPDAAPADRLPAARAKLQQARAELVQANLDGAEHLAKEAEMMGVVFPPAEDTPVKVLHDVAEERKDAKTLLLAARAAMARQDFVTAEKYAKQSNALAGSFTFALQSDNPSKVLKELEELKPEKTTTAMTPSPSPVQPPKPAEMQPTKPAVVVTPKPVDTMPPKPVVTAATPSNLLPARAKLQQARVDLDHANLDAAERLAKEAELMAVIFPPAEDTPAKVLHDVAEARKDAKVLLLAARAAMARQDYFLAEKYAKQSDALSGTFTFSLSSDSPAKVLKEVEERKAARTTVAVAPKPAETQSPKPAPAPTPPARPEATTEATPPTRLDAMKDFLGFGNKSQPGTQTASTSTPPATSTVTTTTAAKQPAPAVQDGSAQTNQARTLLQQGRKSLEENKLVLAKQCAEKAKTLKPNLAYWEDTPEKLLADIGRAEARLTPAANNSIVQVSGVKPAVPAAAPDKKLPTTKEEAVALVKTAREQLAAGKIEEAQTSAIRAKNVRNASWGLFEDSPDSVLKDVEKARVKRDQAESVKVLAEGRKLMDKGDYDGAMRAAYRAQKLHGSYDIWEFGDRPDKLLADAQTMKNKPHKIDPAQTAVVKKDDKSPGTTVVKDAKLTEVKPAVDLHSGPQTPGAGVQTASTLPPLPLPASPVKTDVVLPPLNSTKPDGKPLPTPTGMNPTGTLPPVDHNAAKLGEARQMLSEARAWIRAGNLEKAKVLAGMVADMKVTLLPSDDSPAAIYAEIDRINKANGVTPVVERVPGLPLHPMGAVQPTNDEAKAKAVQLLVEGRRLQKEGKLLEARQKCLEAMQSGATFAPDEDSPPQAVLEITRQAKQRVEMMSAQATELAGFSGGDPLARYQKAEEQLLEARNLAAYVGLDTATIDSKLAWVQELRAAAGGAATKVQPTGPVLKAPTPGIQSTSLVQIDPSQVQQQRAQAPAEVMSKGQQLLDSARRELRTGAVSAARKLAMEALADEYGVHDEALAVLRTLDAEEFNMKVHDTKKTFEAVVSAYNRGDYNQASILLGAIDIRLLDDGCKERMRELMQTPGMQVSRQNVVARTDAQSPGGVGVLLPSIEGEGPVKVRVSDMKQPLPTPEADILNNTASLRNIKYGQLRREGLDTMSDASEKFHTGQTTEALEMLQDYLVRLEGVHELDAAQLAQLRKPVQNRMENFKLMKAQDEFQNADKKATAEVQNRHNKKELAEENRQKKVADLMKQCNALVKEGKLEEAGRLAMVVKQMDPDDPAVEALVGIIRMTRNVKEAKDIKDERAAFWLGAINDTDHVGPLLTTRDPIAFDQEITDRAKKRPSLIQLLQNKTPAMLATERRLMAPVNINFKDVPLRQAIEDMRQTYGMNFWIDEHSVNNAGINIDRPVTVRLEGVSLKTALELLLRGLNLSYITRENYIEINTKDNAKGQLTRKTYPVMDLIVPVENSMLTPPATPVLPGQQNHNAPYAPTPIAGGYAPYSPGTPIGTPMGGSSNGPFASDPGAGSGGAGTKVTYNHVETRQDLLIRLIMDTIEPTSWADAGGTGTIDYFPMTAALVINQTLDIQEQVADLLQALRRLQDQEVAIEVRLITVDEDYYERIGLDFNLNISNSGRDAKFEPALLNGSFAPANFINAPNFRGLLSGLTPAGTLTPDLGIPISPNSYSLAVPPFGGYQGAGVGGLTLGLAFLSDIQVSMLLEAVAGDSRSSVSQSPRVTLQNGQNATILVTENLQNLVTGINFDPLPDGRFALVPVIQPFGNTVQMNISAVISADRRFVRLTPNLQLMNISSSLPIPQFPVLLPIYTGLNVADANNSVVFTQYVQQPRTSSIQIQTTVTVPDGGTVIMGGLKRMSEGRVEYGPPVLSQIPYIDRLFRNVGYGRTGTSILIMVTPRIIIQEEEEERATGFRVREAVAQ